MSSLDYIRGERVAKVKSKSDGRVMDINKLLSKHKRTQTEKVIKDIASNIENFKKEYAYHNIMEAKK